MKDKPIGVVHKHRWDVTPVEASIRLTLAVTDGYRIPRPTRDADHFAGEIKRNIVAGQVSEK